MGVAPCPPELPAGFFWYGCRHSSPGRPPKWVDQLLNGELYAEPGLGAEIEGPQRELEPNQDSTTEPVIKCSDTVQGATPDANSERLELNNTGAADIPAAIANERWDAPVDTQQQDEEAAATPALNCDQEVVVQGLVSRTWRPKESTLPTNSPWKNTKCSLRKKRSPFKKLIMTVILRMSFTRGGGDVAQ